MDIELANIGLTVDEKDILQSISTTVRSGEFVSLLGASGAGKSTLLKVIAGVLPQTTGTVLFDGRIVDALPAHKRRCPMVFQDIRLFPNMNVLDNVAFPGKVARVSRPERNRQAVDLLEQVGLAGFEKRAVSELSGGQAQRVALARALASEPRALLLDEPFAGLDEQLRDDMRSLTLRLHREHGIVTIMVTHDASEALRMSDRICYISHGRLIQEGTPQQLYDNPASYEIAQCHGECSKIEGVVRNGLFVAGGLCLPAPGQEDGAHYAIVRNAGVSLSENPTGNLRVRCGAFCGEGWLTRVDVDGQTLSVPTAKPLDPGTPITVEVSPRHCFFFDCAE